MSDHLMSPTSCIIIDPISTSTGAEACKTPLHRQPLQPRAQIHHTQQSTLARILHVCRCVTTHAHARVHVATQAPSPTPYALGRDPMPKAPLTSMGTEPKMGAKKRERKKNIAAVIAVRPVCSRISVIRSNVEG